MKRVILILAVVLLLGVMSTAVLAQEQTLSGQPACARIPFQVNPLYEGLIDPADFAPEEAEPAGENTFSHTQPKFNSGRATYLTPAEAAIRLREHMKARDESFQLYIRSDLEYEELINAIMIAAMAHTGGPTEGDYLLWQFAGWGTTVYYEQSGNQYYYCYELQIGYYTTAEQEAELDAAIDQLLAGLSLEGKSDYEKVCAVYDYVRTHVTYDYEHVNDPEYTMMYSAYAALIRKTAVCQGYANLLYRLLLELGIDNRIITGETMEGPHAWNIIRLGDVYYNADVTWDSILGGREYFLRNSENFSDHYRNMEFLLAEFQLVYPISATDYVDGVAGQPAFEPVWGICGDDAIWVLDYSGVLTISGTGATYDYQMYDDIPLWYYWQDCFDSVVIEEGITTLGSNSFFEMDKITSVSLPNTLTSIRGNAFFRSRSLKQIQIPNGVSEIGGNAFRECEALESVSLSNSLRTIGSNAFSNCTALKQIHIPDGVWDMESAFTGCTALTEVTVPASVTAASTAFGWCTSLETVYLECSELYIEMFVGCENLQNIVFSDNIRTFNRGLRGCEKLTELTVPATVTDFHMGGNYQLKTIRFLGDAPYFSEYSFENITATVYYPADNPTWTEAVRQQYHGNITWLPNNGQAPEVPEEPEIPDTPEKPEGVLGDVSGDEILDSYDAVLILQYDVGMITGDSIQLQLADASGDGIVDSYDAVLILQYDVGMITKLPGA